MIKWELIDGVLVDYHKAGSLGAIENLPNSPKSKGRNLTGRGIYRAKVPGGWLVRPASGRDLSSGFAFVPDPNHSWNP